MDKIVLFSVLLLLFLDIEVLGADGSVPVTVAFFPLNIIYGTREIKDRSPQGVPHVVDLGPGPSGQQGGVYQFHVASNSYIEFPNSAGRTLDVRYNITMLCWVYYEGVDGPLFYYQHYRGFTGVHMNIFQGRFYARFHTRDYSSTDYFLWAPSQLNSGWRFVGASYDGTTGKAKLWVDGEIVDEKNVGVELDLGTKDNVRIGYKVGNNDEFFKEKITHMRVFDVALTRRQIQEIKGLRPLLLWKDLGCWKEKKSERTLPEQLDNLQSQMQHPCDITKTIALCYQAAKNAGKGTSL